MLQYFKSTKNYLHHSITTKTHYPNQNHHLQNDPFRPKIGLDPFPKHHHSGAPLTSMEPGRVRDSKHQQ
ncbi:hypothetical protein JTE90_020521 [Oedothorax gibbosus]|uniref:Uncharacterized protein n=1 Tax=Oedothorax gibbosus TaxID=931172 RepID=A0AAV6TZB5_9ARAC|nr:hypothetical protein JTE90_020521 [Oedothorax gibbosus]